MHQKTILALNKNTFILFALTVLAVACNNPEKDSVEKADSANKAYLDTALTHNMVVVDEESSAFLVKAANSNMTESKLAELAQKKSQSPKIKSFSSMLLHDHSVLNDQMKSLAFQLKVILPDTIGHDEQKQLAVLLLKKGSAFDKNFMEAVIKNHEEAIGLYEKALLNTKDPDVNSFADKTLMTLHMHLDSAKSIRSAIN